MKKAGGGGRDDPGVMTDLIYVADHEPFGNAIEDQALPRLRGDYGRSPLHARRHLGAAELCSSTATALFDGVTLPERRQKPPETNLPPADEVSLTPYVQGSSRVFWEIL